jgi:predicted transposase YbfD/YdcC
MRRWKISSRQRKRADFAGVSYDAVTETDKGHGRVQRRRYCITENLETLPHRPEWKGLRSIGMAVRGTWEGNRRSEERRYFIASIAAQAKPFATAVRQHWGIENQLHWRAPPGPEPL